MRKDKHNRVRERLVIKELTRENLDQFNDLFRYAFQVSNNELVSLGYEEDEIKKSKSPIFDKSKVIGWFDGEKLASQIAVYPMRVNIHGRIYKMGGVTGVATYPEYSNMGLMNDLMIKSLEEMKSCNQSISFLYPYSIPFYRRKGWEVVSDKMSFTIKDTQLPKQVSVSGTVERVPTEHPDLKAVHKDFTAKRHGSLIRGDFEWEEYWKWDVDDINVAIYYNEDGKPTGYVAYLIENDIFKIKELVYLNQEARHGIWNFISAHFSMIDEVIGDNYTSEPIAFILEDPEIKETICPYIMARITDVEKFITDYPFSYRPKTEKIHLIIDDPMAKWNSGDFSIFWDDNGRTLCKKGEKSGHEIKMNIQTLTAMLMSYKTPSYLQRIERIEGEWHGIHLLESIIPKEQPYFSDYF